MTDAMAAASAHPLSALRADGGAATMDLLLQLQAEQSRMPVARPRSLESTALGAATVAGLAEGVWSSVGELAALWEPPTLSSRSCRSSWSTRCTPAGAASWRSRWDGRRPSRHNARPGASMRCHYHDQARADTMDGTARRGRCRALAPPECWESNVAPRHPRLRVLDHVSRRKLSRSLAVAVASLTVVGGTLAVYGTTDIGVAPAADTVLNCTDTWTGNGGTTDWGTAANWSTGVPNDTGVDACIPDATTVVIADASFSVGELTVARGSTLAVGGSDTGGSGRSVAERQLVGLVGPEQRRDPDRRTIGTRPLDAVPQRSHHERRCPRGVRRRHHRQRQRLGSDQHGHHWCCTGRRALCRRSIEPEQRVARTACVRYRRATDVPVRLRQDHQRVARPQWDGGPVLDNGFTPTAGAEYFVDDGPSSGTFATVLNGARVDSSHPGELGLVGGAPANATAVTVASAAPTSVFGQEVSVTATVTSSSGTSPTGWVAFRAGAVLLGSAPVVTAAGVSSATLDTSDLPVGSDSVTAAYGGDLFAGAATSPVLSHVVNPDSSNLALAPSLTNPAPDQPVTYTATVSPAAPGAGAPAGTVSLTDDGIPVAGCQSLTLPPGGPAEVTCSETYGSDATHAIVATYSGDADFLTATADVDETVAPLPSTTSVTVSSSTLTSGEAISFTAAVEPTAGTEDPTGSVTFTDNGAALGTSILTATEGVTTTSMLTTTLPLGRTPSRPRTAETPTSQPARRRRRR